MTSLDSLVPDVALNILSHLSPRDLTATAAVSRQCCRLAQDDLLWRRFSPSFLSTSSSARRQHMRQIAWRTGRAVHHTSSVFQMPVHAIRLMTGGNVAYMTTVQYVDHPSVPDDLPMKCSNPSVRVISLCIPFTTDRICATAFAPVAHGQIMAASLTKHDGVGGDRLVTVHSAAVTGYHDSYVADTDSESGTTSTKVNCRNQMSAVPIFSARRRGVSSISVSASNQATVVFGTQHGSLFGARQGGSLTHSSIISSNPVTALSISPCGMHTLAGSAGGEVVQVDIETCKVIRAFVGPCSCAISAMSCAKDMAIAGVSHAVAGNGHGSLAVAWDIRAKGRLAAFGRGAFGASSAVPAAPVSGLATVPDAPRVALLVAGQAYVYDMASWSCFVHADLGDTLAMDIDGYRLALFCKEDSRDSSTKGRIRVLDFDKAVEFMPHQVSCFQPFGGRDRDWSRRR